MRNECEDVLRDVTAAGGHVRLIRINPDAPECETHPERCLSLRASALTALRRLDALMQLPHGE